MDKRFWAIIGVIGIIFVGIIWANNRQAGAPEKADTTSATSHTIGDNNKGVTLIEYGDFQCPVCGLYEPTVEQVVEKYKSDISFQYRHFPLQQIHPNAFAASRAAEAAHKQNKFWEMHHKLFSAQNDWSNASDPLSFFARYAKELGMNEQQFRADFASKSVNDAIQADLGEGNKLKITGTPTFILNGKKLELEQLIDSTSNGPSVEKFSALIDAAIKEQESKKSPSDSSQNSSETENQ